MSILGKMQIAQEAISFQSNQLFYKEATQFFEEFRKIDKKSVKVEDLAPLVSITKHHTGILGKFELSKATSGGKDFGLAVMVPLMDRNNPMIQNRMKIWFPEDQGVEQLEKTAGVMSGWVDLRNAKVGGIYSDVEVTFYVPVDMTHGIFTPGEMAATFLHEVGHVFSYFENMTRNMTTNYALHHIARAMEKSNQADVREHVLLSVKKALELKDLDVKTLAKHDNVDLIQTAVIAASTRNQRSAMKAAGYDNNNFEYMADNFAARQGAQRDLVTALDKIYRATGNIATRSNAKYLTMEIVKVCLMFFPFAAGITQAIAVAMKDNDEQNDTYDRPFYRLQRIRNQLIEESKDTSTSKDRQKQLQDDVMVIDNIMATVKDRMQWYDLALNFILPWRRKHFDAEKFQNELEKIASSDLFLKAAKLRQL